MRLLKSTGAPHRQHFHPEPFAVVVPPKLTQEFEQLRAEVGGVEHVQPREPTSQLDNEDSFWIIAIAIKPKPLPAAGRAV